MAPIAYIVEFSSFNLAVTVLPAGARNITAAQHKGALCGRRRLGGHLKTGHAWTSQNRPWRVAEDRFCFTLPQ
jgi:hypothetical protein